ncbi:MAG: response regulator [Thermodesulfobacteriota bacterium]
MTVNGSSAGPGIKLLLVDDEVAYVNILAKRLSKRGFDVKVAVSGTQGIQAVRQHDFDVAVLDLKMEDIDGIEVLKIFKKMLPQMAVIMLTGHGSEQAAREGIRFGAFDYLTKPCELDELVKKIRESYESQKKLRQPGPQ